MTIQDLQRIKLQGTLEAPATTLADEAAAVLGFSANSVVVVQATLLASTLAALDIEVLNWRDVLQYQYQKQAEENCKRLEEPGWQWRNDLSWSMTPIDKYNKPIPDFVLHKAIQIKKALPECEILVEELQQSPDPFLIVRVKHARGYGYEGYYVEVWDESSFEHRL